MFNFFNKSDSDVKRDVINELTWDPKVNSTQIEITADDGIVTLRGSVPHYIDKISAEQATQRVGGVKAVADELEVKGIFDKSDEEISRAALNAFAWNYSVPEQVKISVEKGWLTLRGEVEWEYQRTAAANAVSSLLGVYGITNNISIKAKALPTDVKTRIEEALKRSAEAEGRAITVTVHGDKVTLKGHVHSFSESEDARLAAWNAPGVMSVDDQLTISR